MKWILRCESYTRAELAVAWGRRRGLVATQRDDEVIVTGSGPAGVASGPSFMRQMVDIYGGEDQGWRRVEGAG